LTTLIKKLDCNCLGSQVIDCSEFTQFFANFLADTTPIRQESRRSVFFLGFRGRNEKKLNDLDVGTKKTKLFTRESPQDNINASFLKPTTVEDKSMGFVSRRKKIGANHGYQNPMNHIQKFHSKNVVERLQLY
jgi:hypothetical protein